MSEIKKERTLARTVDDLQRLVGESVCEVLSRLAKFQMRYVPEFASEAPGTAIGPPIGVRGAPVGTTAIYVETVRLGKMIRVAEMPLADERGEVAGPSQKRRECRLGVWQVWQRIGLDEGPVLWTRPRTLRPDSHVQACGVTSREQSGPSRRTDRHRIRVGEPHALGRQTVEVWRLMQISTIAADVRPPQVVGANKNDVGSRVSSPE